jgi:hypothetical protein
MLQRGADLASTARVLGHATPHVTAVVYAHALDRGVAGALEALSDVYEGVAKR